MGASPLPKGDDGAEYKGFKVGDIVTIPEKVTRRKKREDFFDPQKKQYWVVCDFDKEEEKIAITRYSSGFESVTDCENSLPFCWCWRSAYLLRPTGHNVVSYRQQLATAAEGMREQHDLELTPSNERSAHNLELMAPTVNNLFEAHDDIHQPAKKTDWKAELEDFDTWLEQDDNSPGINANGQTLAFSLV